MCLRIMHVCVVFSDFEITGVYGNWYNARGGRQVCVSTNINHTLDLLFGFIKFLVVLTYFLSNIVNNFILLWISHEVFNKLHYGLFL